MPHKRTPPGARPRANNGRKEPASRINEAKAKHEQLLEKFNKRYGRNDRRTRPGGGAKQRQADDEVKAAQKQYEKLLARFIKKYGPWHEHEDSLEAENKKVVPLPQDSTNMDKYLKGRIKELVNEELNNAPALAEMSIGVRYCLNGSASITGLGPTLIRGDLYDVSQYDALDAKEPNKVNRYGVCFRFRPHHIPLYFETGIDYEHALHEDLPQGFDTTRTDWDFFYRDRQDLKYGLWVNYDYLIISQSVSFPVFGIDIHATKPFVWFGSIMREVRRPGAMWYWDDDRGPDKKVDWPTRGKNYKWSSAAQDQLWGNRRHFDRLQSHATRYLLSLDRSVPRT
ncbi:MAG: hypothetical protein IPO90_10500 [Flavobacteriales bacterium]|nr:hypothetical protein [Flavobacteriales bacterium]